MVSVAEGRKSRTVFQDVGEVPARLRRSHRSSPAAPGRRPEEPLRDSSELSTGKPDTYQEAWETQWMPGSWGTSCSLKSAWPIQCSIIRVWAKRVSVVARFVIEGVSAVAFCFWPCHPKWGFPKMGGPESEWTPMYYDPCSKHS